MELHPGEHVIYEGHPSWRSIFSFYLTGLLIVAAAVAIPTLVGSGITPENVAQFAAADAFIVGSSPKRDGLWSNPVDPARAAALVKAFERIKAP